ncbi:uncharacterized protein LOC141601283 [Silene latifolia]|uniref:uncharacterized protein LOC141601283 n=1 Tax=Silene latifolia TaxID=37657 RepID=UPI003D77863D
MSGEKAVTTPSKMSELEQLIELMQSPLKLSESIRYEPTVQDHHRPRNLFVGKVLIDCSKYLPSSKNEVRFRDFGINCTPNITQDGNEIHGIWDDNEDDIYLTKREIAPRTQDEILKLRRDVLESNHLTRSGRPYRVEKASHTSIFKDVPDKVPSKEPTLVEALNEGSTSEASLIKQLQKTKADVSIWQLILSSFEHRQALLQALMNMTVSSSTTSDNMVTYVAQSQPRLTNAMTFSDEDLPPFGPKHCLAMYIAVVCLQKHIPMTLVDDGSAVNVLPLRNAHVLGLNKKDFTSTTQTVQAFDGTIRRVSGIIDLVIQTGSIKRKAGFQIIDVASSFNVLMGRSWIHAVRAMSSTLHRKIKIPFKDGTITIDATPIVVAGGGMLPPNSDIENVAKDEQVEEEEEEVEPPPQLVKGLEEYDQRNSMIEDIETINVGTTLEPQELKIGTTLDLVERQGFIDLLEIAEHRISIKPGFKLVKQKLRRMRSEWSLMVKEEIDKQLKAGFIKVSEYSDWVANVVSVTKKDGKVRVCVDFRDLNKASPKDDFPLPHIDILVDNTANHALLSFMDGYDGYNQIKMAEEDMSKTTFTSQWGTYYYMDDQCQAAFDKVKEVLSSLPVLSPPVAGLPLSLYLTITDITMGAMLAQTVDKEERAIYYISKKLLDYEVKYTSLEKTCLALVWATKKLRHYMLSYSVSVYTKMDPIKYLFEKPVLNERMLRWTLMLSEFNLKYVPLKVIKGRAVADFLADNPIDETEVIDTWSFPDENVVHVENYIWDLYLDGASNNMGYKVGILLISPTGEHVPVSIKLDFNVTNNATEYEACLLGLRSAIDLGVKKLLVHGDSSLVINQVGGSWKIKQSLALYQTRIEELEKYFEDIRYVHPPRE